MIWTKIICPLTIFRNTLRKKEEMKNKKSTNKIISNYNIPL